MSGPPGNRRRATAARLEPDRLASAVSLTALGVGGGLATYPAWLWWTTRVGAALGLPPTAPGAWPACTLGMLLVTLGVAPLVEEAVFRGVFLDAFGTSRLGRSAGVVASSAAFAGAHSGGWARLATFGVGLALGATRVGGAGLGYCVALHAGLNLGATMQVWRGATPLLTAGGALAWVAGGVLSRRWRRP
jgi:membrane protease YdiL (CAAX protease family)